MRDALQFFTEWKWKNTDTINYMDIGHWGLTQNAYDCYFDCHSFQLYNECVTVLAGTSYNSFHLLPKFAWQAILSSLWLQRPSNLPLALGQICLICISTFFPPEWPKHVPLLDNGEQKPGKIFTFACCIYHPPTPSKEWDVKVVCFDCQRNNGS